MADIPSVLEDAHTAAAADLDSALPMSHTLSPNEQEGDDFPSVNLCPFLMNEPPVAGAYFDVRGSDGQLSCQLFEYSRLYRYISTIDTGRAMRSVCHPINGGWINRAQAMTLIRRVPPELQDQLDVEHRQRGLPHEDELPLLQQDYLNNSATMSRILTPYVLL
jgi:hypothetical protein